MCLRGVIRLRGEIRLRLMCLRNVSSRLRSRTRPDRNVSSKCVFVCGRKSACTSAHTMYMYTICIDVALCDSNENAMSKILASLVLRASFVDIILHLPYLLSEYSKSNRLWHLLWSDLVEHVKSETCSNGILLVQEWGLNFLRREVLSLEPLLSQCLLPPKARPSTTAHITRSSPGRPTRARGCHCL